MARLHARLAGVYFCYFATVGAFIPYWGPYLEHRGFSAALIGTAFALMGLTRSFMPVLWGWWADRSGRPVRMLRWAAAAAFGLFACIPFAGTAQGILLLLVAQSFFWHALLSQFEAVSVQHLLRSGGDYSRIRLWGSVGFVAVVFGAGLLLDVTGLSWVPWIITALFSALVLSLWQVPEVPAPAARDEPAPPLVEVLRQPAVLALLAACALSQFSFAAYYGFFTLYLEHAGYSRGTAGFLWALGVLAEIVLFIWMGRLIHAVGARRLMLVVLAATSLRWALTPLVAETLWALTLLQLSHALTFGAYHALAIHYVQRFFPHPLQGRGQALYNAAAFGVGGATGSLAAGWTWETVSPGAVFAASAVAAALATAVAWRGLPRTDAPAGGSPG